MLFICYPKCTTCQKARKWLDQQGVSYTLRDIKEDRPTREELSAWWKASGLPLKKFFNTSGQLYKSLGLKDRLKDMTEEEQLTLLATDGMLVKRPVLVDGDPGSGGLPARRMGEKIKELPATQKRKLDNMNKRSAAPAKTGPRSFER